MEVVLKCYVKRWSFYVASSELAQVFCKYIVKDESRMSHINCKQVFSCSSSVFYEGVIFHCSSSCSFRCI